MIKEKDKFLRKLLIFFDVFVIASSFLIAYTLRQYIHSFYKLDLFPEGVVFGELHPFRQYSVLLSIALPLWSLMLIFGGMYKSFRVRGYLEAIWIVFRSAVFTGVFLGAILFTLKLSFVSRSFLILFFSIAISFLILEKVFIIFFFRYVRKQGYNYRNLLIVGTGKRAENFIRLVRAHREWGFRIVGLIDNEKALLGKVIEKIRVIGLLRDIPDILHREVVDEVVFLTPRSWLDLLEPYIKACEIEGIKVNIAVDLFDLKIAKTRQTELNGLPILRFETSVDEEWQLFIKRSFDIMTSMAGLITLMPIFLILSILIIFTSGRPIFFRQLRCGLNGRKFVMYKFRTMVNGAEEKRKELEGFNELNGPVFKMKDDPRVTRIGNFLRRTSLDELPQLFNVLRGEMSIVGPRPPIPGEVDRYEVWQRRRLSMKPGLTCLWQVNGRNNVDFEKWMRLDLEYIDNWSLGLDFKILLKTVPVVLFSIGAR